MDIITHYAENTANFYHLRKSLGVVKARKFIKEANRLFNGLEIVELRPNCGVVTLEARNYYFNSLTCTDRKEWTKGFKLEINEQFNNVA